VAKSRNMQSMDFTSMVIPPQETMVENICGIYAQASEFDMKSGLDWYIRTRQYCAAVAEFYSYPLQNVVGAYAVISPSLTKEVNDAQIVKACFYHKIGVPLETVKIGTYGKPNRRKAERCLNGDLTAVGGDKVTRFYRNILGIGDMDVTVDRWALRVAMNDATIQDTQGLTKKQYMAVHDAYVVASEQLGLKPLQAQSITWEVLRNRLYRNSGDVAYK
jgi:hypothetical protein